MRKIVVRMPNWLGDLVMSTPVLKALRKRYPKAHITAMCQSNVADLLINNPNIDEIWRYNRPKNRKEKKEIIKWLKEKKFDLGILLTNSFSSAWWFFRGKVKKRIGFACNLRSLFLTKPVPFPKNRNKQHLVFTYLTLIGEKEKKTSPELFVSKEEKDKVKQILQNNGWIRGQKIIGFSPGAAFGTAKRWLPKNFRALTGKFTKEPNVQVICLGHKSELEFANTICHSSRTINLVGKTSLRELIAIISLCSAFLANDSGPMHIAAALQTPLVAIFGPTDENISRPYPKGEVIHKHISCSPCHKRECPRNNECMKAITVNEIYEKLSTLIS